METQPRVERWVLHASVPRAQAELLQALARDNDRTISAEIRRAVAQYLERPPRISAGRSR